jgi:NAD(P)-dependent dehydrogenase (short-subunit alcohol dehydrogenase family)
MSERRYIVTGAASGIGRAVAEQAAAEGASISLVDISAEPLEELASALRASGTRATAVVADLTSADEAVRVVEDSVAFLGGLDVLISNAGAPELFLLKDLTVAAFDRAIALNVRATWLLGQAARPHLIEAGGGSVVATGSACGHHPAPPQGAYGIAKAGLLMLVRHMALEWGPDGIRANSVSPGPTMTGLTEGVFNDLSDPKQKAVREMREAKLPLGKLGTPEEVAAAIMFLASPAASQITGIDIVVDGGMSTVLMPSAGVSTGQS